MYLTTLAPSDDFRSFQLFNFRRSFRYTSFVMAPRCNLRNRQPVARNISVSSSSRSVDSGVLKIPRARFRTQNSRFSSPHSVPPSAFSLTRSSPLSTATVTRPFSGRTIPLWLHIRHSDVVRPSAPPCAPARPPLRPIRSTKRSRQVVPFKSASTHRTAPSTVVPIVQSVNTATGRIPSYVPAPPTSVACGEEPVATPACSLSPSSATTASIALPTFPISMEPSSSLPSDVPSTSRALISVPLDSVSMDVHPLPAPLGSPIHRRPIDDWPPLPPSFHD